MARRVKNGFIAVTPKSARYLVKGVQPSGVFVQHVFRNQVEIHYAGEGAGVELGDPFYLPNDPEFLRDIARAINMVAKDIEDGKSCS